MRLTTDSLATSLDTTARSVRTKAWPFAAVIGALLMIFELDRVTGAAPVQHLYYLPIIFAAIRIDRRVGIGVSVAAVVLYHFANPTLLTLRYRESDLVQIFLFVAVGIVTGRLAHDAHRLRRLATTDDLTGLHNLRSFEVRLIEMVLACREARVPLSMLVLDVDRLKSINDTNGHLAGAEAVRTVGHVLAARLPATAVACRYGGDEFAVAIPMCSEVRAGTIADDLRRAINTMAPVLAGRRFAAGTLSISVGIASVSFDTATAVSSDDAATGRALFDAADHGLYAAKADGRNRVGVAR
jgi:diguanylate cyclase (GGDEF)-like protein